MDTSNNDPKNKDSLDIEKIKQERDDYLNGWKRSQADLINFKKEAATRFEDALKMASFSAIKDFLVVLDDLNRALQNEIDVEGVKSIKEKMENILEGQGVKKINSIGEKFDPMFHEAISQVEDENKESQTVVEEIQPGFMLYEKVIRPSKVIIVK